MNDSCFYNNNKSEGSFIEPLFVVVFQYFVHNDCCNSSKTMSIQISWLKLHKKKNSKKLFQITKYQKNLNHSESFFLCQEFVIVAINIVIVSTKESTLGTVAAKELYK